MKAKTISLLILLASASSYAAIAPWHLKKNATVEESIDLLNQIMNTSASDRLKEQSLRDYAGQFHPQTLDKIIGELENEDEKLRGIALRPALLTQKKREELNIKWSNVLTQLDVLRKVRDSRKFVR
jgi:hypothetical protein